MAKDRIAAPGADALPLARRLASRLSGARLCFGKPIRVGERTVVPVAAVRTMGGFGSSRGLLEEGVAERERSAGGGGGGLLDARPVGFIEVGPEGTRFQAIHTNPFGRRVLQGAAAIGAIAGARALRSRVQALPARRRPLRLRRGTSSPWPVRSLGR